MLPNFVDNRKSEAFIYKSSKNIHLCYCIFSKWTFYKGGRKLTTWHSTEEKQCPCSSHLCKSSDHDSTQHLFKRYQYMHKTKPKQHKTCMNEKPVLQVNIIPLTEYLSWLRVFFLNSTMNKRLWFYTKILQNL